MPALSDLKLLLASMKPVLNPGVYVYAILSPGRDAASLEPLASFREREGLTVVLEESKAGGLESLFRCAWITLEVHSDLAAVGLTAAFATALGQAGISCNVMAGAFHDHLFVPVEQRERALAILEALQREAAAG